MPVLRTGFLRPGEIGSRRQDSVSSTGRSAWFGADGSQARAYGGRSLRIGAGCGIMRSRRGAGAVLKGYSIPLFPRSETATFLLFGLDIPDLSQVCPKFRGEGGGDSAQHRVCAERRLTLRGESEIRPVLDQHSQARDGRFSSSPGSSPRPIGVLPRQTSPLPRSVRLPQPATRSRSASKSRGYGSSGTAESTARSSRPLSPSHRVAERIRAGGALLLWCGNRHT